MKLNRIDKFTFMFLIASMAIGILIGGMGTYAAMKQTYSISTQVVQWDQTRINEGDWGEMRVFMEGDTYGTRETFAATAVVLPGKAVHPAHRHAEEEFLVISKGNGTWHVDGKELAANEGDVLYVEPWVFHGLVNTGTEPLTFFVVKWNSKGVERIPEPKGDHGR